MTTTQLTLKPPYVNGNVGALRAALVVRTSAAIERQLPIQGEPSAIVERAREQQGVFLTRLAAHGVKTIVLDADEDAPLGALCGDVAVLFPDGAFLMRPSDLARRQEVAAVESSLEQLGIPVVGRIAAPGLLDGGDVLFTTEALYLGVPHQRQSEIGIPSGRHGNDLGREQLAAYARALGLRAVEVSIAAGVRRLCSVATLLDAKTLLYAPGLVDGEAFAGLEKIDAPRGEDYGAGVLALGGRRVIANLRFRELIPRLRKAKVGVDAIDLWEFGKIGATPSSLALVLKRD